MKFASADHLRWSLVKKVQQHELQLLNLQAVDTPIVEF
jgi:hypothetical protein